MLAGDDDRVEELLSYPPGQVDFTWRDAAGMTLFHHAARLGVLAVVHRLAATAPDLASVQTVAGARPSLWLPLHCAVDAPVREHERKVNLQTIKAVAAVTPDTAFSLPTGTRANVFHLAAGRGKAGGCASRCRGNEKPHPIGFGKEIMEQTRKADAVDVLARGRDEHLLATMFAFRNEKAFRFMGNEGLGPGPKRVSCLSFFGGGGIKKGRLPLDVADQNNWETSQMLEAWGATRTAAASRRRR